MPNAKYYPTNVNAGEVGLFLVLETRAVRAGCLPFVSVRETAPPELGGKKGNAHRVRAPRAIFFLSGDVHKTSGFFITKNNENVNFCPFWLVCP
jgi:hypothetical protein